MSRQNRVLMFWLCLGLVPLYGQDREAIRVWVADGGYLGVQIRDLAPDDVRQLGLPSEAGVYVERVEPQGPAAEAGIEEGDVLVEYAGTPVFSVSRLRRLVSETPAGRSVEVTLIRDKKSLRKTVTVGGRKGADLRRRPEARIEVPDFPYFEFRGPEGQEKRPFLFFSDRPKLGISGVNLTSQMAEFLGVSEKKGVLVMEVSAGSPAEKAGIQAGDAIVKVNGEEIEELNELSRRLQEGSNELETVRKGQRQKVSVQIDSARERAPRAIRM